MGVGIVVWDALGTPHSELGAVSGEGEGSVPALPFLVRASHEPGGVSGNPPGLSGSVRLGLALCC